MEIEDTNDAVAERIFSCLQRFNLKMAAQALQEWELTDAGSSIILSEDQLWHRAKENLAQAYQDLKDDHTTNESAISDGRLIAICIRTEEDGFHFQLEFILCRSESKMGVG